ncbi:DUF5722 domain-containing protein [uncultured Cyclobacterium sp.]|uniref:DUF5722 domain-containing protein n=1 Tax=uncultured Cyclobacterium sp. TaxID=453820 RepID=UPI0030EF27D1|tara:strand:+ start:38100 stop:40202 length:2103 start_codon:yes stop_codon:yes gene_type:complete
MNSLKTILFFLLAVSNSFGQQGEILISYENQNNIEIKNDKQGSYSITAIGPDPYLFTVPLTFEISEEETIFTFEYFSTEYLNNFQVFFGPPVEENYSLYSSLGIREGWSSHSIDVREAIPKGWGKPGDVLRLDFGGGAGYTGQFRNFSFREPNASEIRKAQDKEALLKEKEAYKTELLSYLNTNFPNSITEINVLDSVIVISGFLSKMSPNYYIAEVPMHVQVTKAKEFELMYPISKSQGEYEVHVPRYSNQGDFKQDGLLSGWVILKKENDRFELQSHLRYMDKIEPVFDLEEAVLKNKKGLGNFHSNDFVTDLDSLGVGSITTNMWISKMLRTTPSVETMTFKYNGKEYFADRKWVEKHDKALKEASKRGVITSAIILIDKAVNTPDNKIGDILEHPDCDPSGIYSMANLTNPESVHLYAAAMDFLAKRYSNPKGDHGRVHHWIVHNEVDAGWVWTNMGETDSLTFMDTYHKSLRLINNIGKQYNAHSKAFITLTHYWNWTVDKHFYLSRDLLEILIKYSDLEGDFDWGIAHHPYPESLFEPKSWLDEKATFSFDTPLITFKNIEVLDAWVKQPYVKFKNRTKRTVFLSEQGPNSRDYTPKHLNEQAASIAYLWKKMEVLDGIDAFQFHNWLDNRSEGGLRIGLRKFPDDKEDPAGKKPVWYVYRDLGTDRELESISFAKNIIGISSWDEVRHTKKIK